MPNLIDQNQLIMNVQKLLLATLAGTVVFYFAGWIIWGMVLGPIQSGYMVDHQNLHHEMPNMVFLVLSMLVHAFLFAYIFEKWAGIKTFKTGAKAGALLAVLLGLGFGFMMMAMMNLYSIHVPLIDIVGNLVWGALGGGVIGWMLGRGEE